MSTNRLMLPVLLAFVLGFTLGALTIKKFQPRMELPVISVSADTVVVRDTINIPVPEATDVHDVRRDTVFVKIRPVDTSKVSGGTSIPPDTLKADTGVRVDSSGAVSIPISQRTYSTADYRAVVQGWRPELISMQVYPKTTTINTKETRLVNPRWAVTLGPGAAYDGDKIKPAIVLGVGWAIWSSR